MSDTPTGLCPEIAAGDNLPPVPPEALAMLEEVRRKRALIGIPGPVFLRVDDAPGKPPDWSVIIGETVVRGSGRGRKSLCASGSKSHQ